jgi:hypothetical protein
VLEMILDIFSPQVNARGVKLTLSIEDGLRLPNESPRG